MRQGLGTSTLQCSPAGSTNQTRNEGTRILSIFFRAYNAGFTQTNLDRVADICLFQEQVIVVHVLTTHSKRRNQFQKGCSTSLTTESALTAAYVLAVRVLSVGPCVKNGLLHLHGISEGIYHTLAEQAVTECHLLPCGHQKLDASRFKVSLVYRNGGFGLQTRAH